MCRPYRPRSNAWQAGESAPLLPFFSPFLPIPDLLSAPATQGKAVCFLAYDQSNPKQLFLDKLARIFVFIIVLRFSMFSENGS